MGLNRIYKVIWSKTKGCYVVVSEMAKRVGRNKAKAIVMSTAAMSMAVAVAPTVMNVDRVEASVLIGAANGTTISANNSTVSNNGIIIGGAISKAADESVIIGDNSGSMGSRNVVIGTYASAGYDDKKNSGNPPKDGAFNQSVAIGAGRAAGEGARAYGDQSIAIGSNTIARGNSSIAIGNDDVDKTDEIETTYTDLEGNTKTDKIGNAYKALTGQSLGPKVYQDTTSKEAAVAIGVKAVAGDISLALGTGANADRVNAVAIGSGATATRDNAVAIGGGATTEAPGTKEVNATINDLEFTWAGGENTLAGDVVSFGKAGYERQLKHVAAGKVSETSTDAINGSQFYGVLKHLTADPVYFYGADDSTAGKIEGVEAAQKSADALKKKVVAKSMADSRLNLLGGADKEKLSDNNIGVTYENTSSIRFRLSKELAGLTSAEFKNTAGDVTTINGDGVTITPVANGKKPVSVTKNGLNNGGNVIANVAGNLEGAKPNSAEPTTNATAPNNASTIKNNAATVGDVLQAGWNLQNNSEERDFVKPYDTVDFVDGNGTTAVVDTTDNRTSTVKYDVNLGNGLEKNSANKITIKPADKSLEVNKNGVKVKTDGTTITTGDSGLTVVTGEIEPVTTGTNLGTVKVTDGDAGKIATVDSVVKAVNNAAFTLKASADGGTLNANSTVNAKGELIKAGNTIEMIAGKNLEVKHNKNGKITFATVENPSFNTVQIGDDGPKFSATSGGNISVSDKDGTNPVKITNVKDGDISKTSKDAINGSQFHAVAKNTIKLAGQNGTDAATETAGQELDKQGGIKFTVKSSDGKLLDITADANGDTITITPKTGTITTTGGVPTAVTTNGKLVTVDEVVNALKDLGWKATAGTDGTGSMIGTGAAEELIKAGDTVTFKAGNNLSIKQDGKNFIYSLNPALTGLTSAEFKDGDNKVKITPTGITITKPAGTTENTVTLNQNGLNNGGNPITNVGSNLDGAKAGTDVPTTNHGPINSTDATDANYVNPKNAATVGDVLQAGWNLQGNNTAVDFVKPYDTVNFVDGDGTTVTVINTDTKTSTVKYSINPGNGLEKDDTTKKVQVKRADKSLTVEADGVKVNPGDKSLKTTEAGLTVNTADKSLEVTDNGLKVKTDTKTITTGDNGLTVNTGTVNAVTEGDKKGTVEVPTADAGKIATVDTVAKAVNNASFTLKASAITGGTRNTGSTVTATGESIKAGNTIEMIAGKNLDVTHNTNGKIIFATVENPSFNTVQIGNSEGPKFSATTDGNIRVSDKTDTKPVKITNVADGTISDSSKDAINGSQIHKLVNKAIKLAGQNGSEAAGETEPQTLTQQDPIKFTVKSSDGSLLHVEAAGSTITLTPKTGTITTGEDGIPTANTAGGKLVTADNLVKALTEMGWKATAGTDGTGTMIGAAATEELIKSGNTVTFKAGNNLAIKQDSKNFIYSLKTDLTGLTSAEFKDGNNNAVKITPNGVSFKKPNATDADTVTLNQNGLNNGGNPITNVAGNLQGAKAGTDAPTTNATAPSLGTGTDQVNKNNAATVGDVLNAGWNLQNNDAAKDFVKPYDTVNFVNGEGTTAVVETTDQTTSKIKYNVNTGKGLEKTTDNKITVKPGDKSLEVTDAGVAVKKADQSLEVTDDGLKVKTDNTTIKTGDTGLTVNTGTINKVTEGNTAGTVVAKTGDENKIATVSNVVEAINNAAWTATSAATTAGELGATATNQLVKAGDKVTFEADKNIKITQAGSKFTFTTRDDVSFNTVQIGGNQGPKFSKTDAGDIKVSGSDNTTPVKITNVQDGEISDTSTDAINGSQFHAVAKNTIKLAGQNGTSAATETDEQELDKKGGIKFTVKSSNGDLLEVTAAKDTITITPKTATITTGKDGVPTANTNDGKLVTADQLVTALTEMGWKATADKDDTGTVTGNAPELIKAGETVTFKAGDNLSIKQDHKNFTYSLNPALTGLTSAEFKDGKNNTVNITPEGITITKPADQTAGTPKNTVTLNQNGLNNGGNAISNVKSNLPDTKNSDTTTGPNTATKSHAAPTLGTSVNEVNPANAATVGDVLNAGWNLQGNGTEVDFVKPYDTVNFVNGVNTTAVVSTVDGKTSNVTYNVTGLPITYTDKDGNLVSKIGDEFYKVNDKGQPLDAKGNPSTKVNKDGKPVDDAGKVIDPINTTNNPVKTSLVNPAPETNKTGTTSPTTLDNVTSKLENYKADPVNGKEPAKNSLRDLTNTNVTNDTVATVGDIRNMGWIVSSDKTTGANGAVTADEYSEAVKNANEVRFVGEGSAIVSGKTAGNVRTITVKVDNQTGTNKTVTPVNYTKADGTKVYPQEVDNGNGTKTVKFFENPDGSGKEIPSTEVITSVNGPKGTTTPAILSNVKSNLPDTKNSDTTNTATDPSNATTSKAAPNTTNKTGDSYINPNNAATVSDVLNAGWNLQGNGTAVDFVKPYDTVNFVNGLNTTAVVSTVDGTTSNVTYNVTGLPVTYTTTDGTPVTKIGDKYYKVNDQGQPVDGNGAPVTKFNKDGKPLDANGHEVPDVDITNNPLTTSVVNAKPAADKTSTTSPTTLSNVEGNLDGAKTNTIAPITNATAPNTTNKDGDKYINPNNAATVGDVLNAGWNLQNNGAAKDFVKPYDTVNFVNGLHTTAVVTTSDDGKTSNITYNVTGLPVTYATADGTPVSKIGDKFYKVNDKGQPVDEQGNPSTKVNNNGEPIDGNGNVITPIDTTANPLKTSLVNPTPETNKTGTTSPTTLDNVTSKLENYKDAPVNGKDPVRNSLVNLSKPENGQPNVSDNTVATVGDLRNMGWIVSSNKTTGENGAVTADEYSATVKNANEVKFVGEGTAIVSGKTEGDVRTITVKVDDQTSTNNAVTPVVYTDKDGKQVYPTGKVGPDGNQIFNTKPDGKGEEVTGPVKTTINGPKGTTSPTTLSNVEGNLEGAKTGTNAPTTSATAPTLGTGTDQVNKNNAATVGDVLQAGWNLQNNGAAKDFVKPYDTVNFVNGLHTTAVVTTSDDGKTSNITYNVTGLPVTYATADGTPVSKIGDKFYKVNDKGQPVDEQGNPSTKVNNNGEPIDGNGNVITPIDTTANPLKTSLVNPTPETNKTGTTSPTTLDNVTSKLENYKDAPVNGKDPVRNSLVNLSKPENGQPNVSDNTVATVGDLRNMGWIVSSNKTTGENGAVTADEYSATVKNANEVKFVGEGTAIVSGKTEGDVRTITVKVDDQTSTNNAVTPVVYTDKDGKQVYPTGKVGPDGNQIFNTKPDGKGEEVTGPVKTTINGPKGTTSPTTLSNVEGNLEGAKTGTNAPTTSATAPTLGTGTDQVNKNNAATVGDVLQAGWNLQNNGTAVDFVKPYDTVNFVNGLHTTAVVSTVDGKTSNVTYNVTGLPITYTDKDGNPVSKIGDKYYKVNEQGQPVDANGKPATKINEKGVPVGEDGQPISEVNITNNPLKTSLVNPTPETNKTGTTSPTTLDNVTSKLENYKDAPVNGKDPVRNSLVNLSKPENGQPNVSDNTVATVGDLRNMGWIVSSNKTTGENGAVTADEYSATVKNANEVKFVGEGTAIVSGKTEGDVRTITVKVDDQTSTNNAVTPVVYTDKDGKQVYPTGKVGPDGNQIFNTKPDGKGEEVTGPVKTTINGPKGTNSPTSLNNVKNNIPNVNDGSKTITDTDGNETAGDVTNINKAPLTAEEAAALANPKTKEGQTNPKYIGNNAATVSDVLNAGWNLTGNGTAVDFVKPYDTVNFRNGGNTTVSVTTDDNLTSHVQVNVTGLPVSNTITDPITGKQVPVVKVGDAFYRANPDGTPDIVRNDKGEPTNGYVRANDGKLYPRENVTVTPPTDANGTPTITPNTGATPTTVNTNLVNPNVDNTTNEPGNNVSTPNQLGNVANGANTFNAVDADGKDYVKANNGKYYEPSKVNADGSLKEGTNATADAKNPLVLANDGKWYPADKVSDKGTPEAGATAVENPLAPKNAAGEPLVQAKDGKWYKPSDLQPNGTPTPTAQPQDNVINNKAGLVDFSNSNPNNAATIGDLQNMGWVVSAQGNSYSDQVRNTNEVKFVGEGTASVTGKTDDKGVRTITVKVDDQVSTNNSVTPVVYTDKDGKTVYPIKDDKGNVTYHTTPDGKGENDKVIPNGDVNTSINGPKDDQGNTRPASLSNVKNNIPAVNDENKTITDADGKVKPDAGNVENINKAPMTAKDAADLLKPMKDGVANPKFVGNNAATVSDVLNAGWNLQNNGAARDFVKPFDTVNFVNGVNTTAVVTTSEDGTTSNVTYNVTGLPVTYTTADGTPVSKIGDKYYKVNDKGQPIDEQGNPSTKVNNNGEPIDGNGNVINAIDTAANPLKTSLVNPAPEANKTGTTSPTTLDNVTSKLANYSDPDVNGKAPVRNNLVDLSKPENGQPNVSDNTVATVGDLRNMGWIVSSNKATDDLTKDYSDTVKNANEVKFVGEGTAIVSGKTDDKGVRTITVKVDDQTSTNNSVTPIVYTKADGTQVYPTNKKDDQGHPIFNTKADGSGDEVPGTDVVTSVNGPNGTKGDKAPTTLKNVKNNIPNVNDGSKTITNPDGTEKAGDVENINKAPLTAEDAAKLSNPKTADGAANPNYIGNNAATVSDVLNAGWNLQNNGESRDFVKPYDTVNFINGLGTTAVVTTREGSTTSDVTFNVKAANGSVTVDEDGVKVTTGEMKPKVGADNKETGAIATPVDPTTAKQLKDTLDAAVKELATAKDALKIAETALAAKPNDPALQKDVEDKKAQVAEKQTPVNNAQKAHDDAGLNKVATVQNVAEAINNSGFNLKTSADGGEKLTTGSKNDGELIKPGNTVEMVAGNNLTVKQDEHGKITYATKDDVTFKTVDTGTLNVGSPNTYTDGKGNTYTKVGENYYKPADVENGVPKQGATPVDVTTTPVTPVSPVTMKAEAAKPATNNATDAQPSSALNVTSKDGKPTQITGVGSTLNTKTVDTTPTGTEPGTTPNTTPTNLVDLEGTKDAPVNKNAAATVGDLQNMGWVVSTKDGNGYKDVVKNANVVDFKGDQGVTVTGKTLADGTREITVGIKEGEVTNKVTITHGDGSKTDAVKIGDNYYKVDKDGKPIGFDKDENGKPAGTPLKVDPNTDKVTNAGAGVVTGNAVANAIQDSGWNVGIGSTDKDFSKDAKVYDKVNPNDDVKFANGANTNVSMVTVDALNEDGTKKATTYVKVDINRDLKIDSVTTGGTATDKNGNNLVKVGDQYYKEGDVTIVTNPDGTTTVTPKENAKAVPPADVIPPKDGAMIVKNADGKDVVSATVGKDGNGAFGINGKDGKNGISMTAKDGQGTIGVNGKDGKSTTIAGDTITIKDKDNNATNIGVNTITLVDKAGNTTTTTADKSEIKDAAGNINTNTATGNTLKDPNGNTHTSTASTSELKDKDGNTNASTPTTNVLKDTNGNTNTSAATGTTYKDKDDNKTVVGPKEINISDKSGENTASLTNKDLLLNAKDPNTGVDKTSHVSGDKIAFTTTDEMEKVVDKDGKPVIDPATGKQKEVVKMEKVFDKDGKPVIDPATGKQKEVVKNPGNSTEYTNEGLKVIPNSTVARDVNGNPTFLDKDGKPVMKDTDGKYKYVGQDGKPGDKYDGSVGVLKPNVVDNTRVISFGMDKPVLDKNGKPVTGPDGNPVMTEGISAGMQQIHNVAPGTKDTDGVNVSQLRGTTININNRMNRMGAQAAALAGLQSIQYDPLEPTQISAGLGHYKGSSALALGVNHFKNESTMFHMGASYNGHGDETMMNASVTWKFGARADETAVKDTFRQGPISSAYTLQDKVSALEAQNKIQKDQLEELKALNEKQQEQIAELFKRLIEKA